MCKALADTRVVCIQYRPVEIGIRLLSLTLSFSSAQLYKHYILLTLDSMTLKSGTFPN